MVIDSTPESRVYFPLGNMGEGDSIKPPPGKPPGGERSFREPLPQIPLERFGLLSSEELSELMRQQRSVACFIVDDTVYFLPENKPVSIGRGKSNDIMIDHNSVSRGHATLAVGKTKIGSRDALSYTLTDTGTEGQGSTNGSSFVNKDGLEFTFRGISRTRQHPVSKAILILIGNEHNPHYITNPNADVGDFQDKIASELKANLNSRRAAPVAIAIDQGGTNPHTVLLRKGINFVGKKTTIQNQTVKTEYKSTEEFENLAAEGYKPMLQISVNSIHQIKCRPCHQNPDLADHPDEDVLDMLYDPKLNQSNPELNSMAGTPFSLPSQEEYYVDIPIGKTVYLSPDLHISRTDLLPVDRQPVSSIEEAMFEGEHYQVDCNVLFARASDALKQDRVKQKLIAQIIMGDFHQFKKIYKDYIPQWDDSLLQMTEIVAPEKWDSMGGAAGHQHDPHPAGPGGPIHKVSLDQNYIVDTPMLLRNSLNFHEWLHEYATRIMYGYYKQVIEGGVNMLASAGALCRIKGLQGLEQLDIAGNIMKDIMDVTRATSSPDYIEYSRTMLELAGRMRHDLRTFAYTFLHGKKYFIQEIAHRFRDPNKPPKDTGMQIVLDIQRFLKQKEYDQANAYIASLIPRVDALPTQFGKLQSE